MLSLNTSNILLGCLVFLVAVLVLLKMSRHSPHCRKCFKQQQYVNNKYAHRYDSVRFDSCLMNAQNAVDPIRDDYNVNRMHTVETV